ncbi:MAG: hypothetical protein HY675_15710 [Chloroflexi bacterium]|nr:hypothetical protein [Chloroflexota bacterium]
MITFGIDIGSVSAKAAIMLDGEISSWSLIRTGPDSAETAKKVMQQVLDELDLRLEDVDYIVSTGYGRVVVPFAQKSITEISCHAKGANWFFPSARSILDMGGQDCKAIKCDETGKVVDFAMNDKCAAGTGRYFEIIAGLLDLPLHDIGPLSLDVAADVAPMSSKCAVFARSEAMGMLRRGVPKNEILAAVAEAVTDRVRNLMSRVGVVEDFVISGGIGKNVGVVERIERKLGVRAYLAEEPQIVGAVGAAIFARERFEMQLRKGSKVA